MVERGLFPSVGTLGDIVDLDILVLHPEKHHVLQLVAGCVSCGARVKFVTSFYAKGIGKLGSLLPNRLGRKAKGYQHELVPSTIVNAPLRYGVAKLFSIYTKNRNFYKNFDSFGENLILSRKYKPRLLVTLQDYAPKSVRAAKEAGILVWSDQISNQSEDFRQRMLKQMKLMGDNSPLTFDNTNNERIVSAADVVTFPSNHCFEGMKSFINANAVVRKIPYGARAADFELSQSTRERELVILARANSLRKGGHLFLQALEDCGESLLSLSGGRLNVVILGELEANLQVLCRSLKLPAGMQLIHGNVAHSDIADLYGKASLFVMPAVSEGMSLACIEAMHSRLPLIISKYCGIDGFEDCEMGLEVDLNRESISRALVRAFENRHLWSVWGANAKELASAFTWEAYRQNIANLAQEVLA